MGSLNHTCVICGIQYHHCDDCGLKGDTPWKIVCDRLECYQVFLTVKDYQAGRISKEEARQSFEAIGLNIDLLIPDVRKIVDAFMCEDEGTVDVDPEHQMTMDGILEDGTVGTNDKPQ